MKFAFILFESFTSDISSVQYAKRQLMGKVINLKTHLKLDYATVCLKQDGIVKGATSSDDSGDYIIKNLPAGQYTLEVTYIGYYKFILTEISIIADSITHWNCELKVKDEEEISYCPIHFPHLKLIDETENKRTLRSKEILKLP